eukprot:m.129754 g.129754  ORF g.129754 m.129754 type:complete len:501 (+) comp16768_c0_seq1:294-1796(+)
MFIARQLAGVARQGHAVSAVALQAAGMSTRARPVVVQKYGGTSLGTAEKLEKVTAIMRRWAEDHRLLTVVSALSSDTKAEGTTSRLLAAAEASVTQQPFDGYLDAIADTHQLVIDAMLPSAALREEAELGITREIDIVRQFCQSLQVIREISPRSHDLIAGTGERLASILIAAILKEQGYQAQAVNLSNIFPDGLDTGRPGYHRLATKAVQAHLDSVLDNDHIIPVITGYMGDIKGGIVEGIGRGYSDFTAAITSAAVNADAMQVWKESDGIFTGNPTKVPTAKLVKHVTPREAAELTYFGNEVLHPFTMECAIEANIPIHILNTFKPESGGTVVDPKLNAEKAVDREHPICAIAAKKHVRVLNLQSNRQLVSTTYFAKVFELVARHNLKIDVMSSSEVNLSFTVHESVPDDAVNAFISEVSNLAICTLLTDRAIISVVGEGMRNYIGLASKMFSNVANTGASIEMISQGSSEIHMSAVVRAEHCDDVVKAMHAQFFETP